MNKIRKIIDELDIIIKRNNVTPPIDLSKIKLFDDNTIVSYLWLLSKDHFLIVAQSIKENMTNSDYNALLSKIDNIYELLAEKIK